MGVADFIVILQISDTQIWVASILWDESTNGIILMTEEVKCVSLFILSNKCGKHYVFVKLYAIYCIYIINIIIIFTIYIYIIYNYIYILNNNNKQVYLQLPELDSHIQTYIQAYKIQGNTNATLRDTQRDTYKE